MLTYPILFTLFLCCNNLAGPVGLEKAIVPQPEIQNLLLSITSTLNTESDILSEQEIEIIHRLRVEDKREEAERQQIRYALQHIPAWGDLSLVRKKDPGRIVRNIIYVWVHFGKLDDAGAAASRAQLDLVYRGCEFESEVVVDEILPYLGNLSLPHDDVNRRIIEQMLYMVTDGHFRPGGTDYDILESYLPHLKSAGKDPGCVFWDYVFSFYPAERALRAAAKWHADARMESKEMSAIVNSIQEKRRMDPVTMSNGDKELLSTALGFLLRQPEWWYRVYAAEHLGGYSEGRSKENMEAFEHDACSLVKVRYERYQRLPTNLK